ncbi:hypothetical protein ZHAS_00015125 [Anopheles sinensis]|uniref:Uncharacterized protein n=1 Tax=Anopheles sinensis TaxID=74873 RepID=A0A084WA37_ANOSI|nr:hypothetical protein ZHAS_00015125 [Anopheles sinensis]
MSNNNIGDIVKVDVEAEVDIKSEINVELVNVIAELLLELRDVNVNVCAGSSTTAMPDALPYQQLVRSLAQSKPAGYDAPGLTKDQKEVLWRKHVEQMLQQHVASRQ